jgi:hypothetical protein
MNYGNEKQELGDDEMTNFNSIVCKEAPCDVDVAMLGVVIPNAVIPFVNFKAKTS